MTSDKFLPDLDQFGFLLGRAYYSYIGLLQTWLDEEGLSQHLKPGMGSLLFALFREDSRTAASVAAELQLAKSTMAGMVSRMRDAGLVTLEADAHDGRAWKLKLTPLARSLQPRCLKLADEMEQLLAEKLSARQHTEFRRSLVLVTQTITEKLEARPIAAPPKRTRKSVGTASR